MTAGPLWSKSAEQALERAVWRDLERAFGRFRPLEPSRWEGAHAPAPVEGASPPLRRYDGRRIQACIACAQKTYALPTEATCSKRCSEEAARIDAIFAGLGLAIRSFVERQARAGRACGVVAPGAMVTFCECGGLREVDRVCGCTCQRVSGRLMPGSSSGRMLYCLVHRQEATP